MDDKLALRLVVMYEDAIRELTGLCEEIILLTVAGSAETPRNKLGRLLNNIRHRRDGLLEEPGEEE